MYPRTLIGLAASLALAAGSSTALAQGTGFTYQGQLESSGTSINTPTDLRFSLFTAASGGTQVGSTVTQSAVAVTNGVFSTPVDFGLSPFTANQNLFLQIEVRNPAGSGSFVPMATRQRLTPTPFSLATRGLNVNSAGNTQLAGTLGIGASPVSGNGIRVVGTFTDSIRIANTDAAGISGLTMENNTGFVVGTFGFTNAGNASGLADTINIRGARDLVFAPSTDFGTERMRIKANTGNVGIGTNTPTTRLHVRGTGFTTVGEVPIGIFETDGGSFGPQLRLKHNGPGGQEWLFVSNGSGNGNAGTFGLYREGAADFAFAADPAGWTGVGRGGPLTANASEAFTVAVKPGNTGLNSIYVQGAAGTGVPEYAFAVGGAAVGGIRMDVNGAMNFVNVVGSATSRLFVSGAGDIGVGTLSPQARFHNPGTTRLDGQIRFGDQTWNGTVGRNANLTTFVNAGGLSKNVVLDLSATQESFFIVQQNGVDQIELSNRGNAFKPGGGAWSVLSDERTKSDVQLLSGTLDRLLKLKGHSYSYKPEFVQSGRALPGTQIGLVAQEVEEVFPDWVSTGRDGLKVVTERSTTALMVEAMRDLRNEKDAEINALKARLERLEAMLKAQVDGK